jgi:hypothetical protein
MRECQGSDVVGGGSVTLFAGLEDRLAGLRLRQQ